MKKSLVLIALAATPMFFFSCSKSEISKPATTLQTSAIATEQAAAAARTTPAPGNYNVTLFVNDADTSTAEFAGYVFTFKATGVLTATVGKDTYNGKWESKAKDNGTTELKLDIDGTPAIHQINKSWNEKQITNTKISLAHPEHGINGRDVLIFNKV